MVGGSSPLTRGKPRHRLARKRLAGLIPAHAGKTFARSIRSTSLRAHPRSRGENTPTTARPPTVTGSSPLTRGKQIAAVGGHGHERLIPAHAGKTLSCLGGDAPPGAHPRSRGENAVMNHPAAAALGSSPLTRGKLIADRITGKTIGLIPAHAGKTARRGAAPIRARAHPRSRGENAMLAQRDWHQSGSSPLTRGKRSAHRRSHH